MPRPRGPCDVSSCQLQLWGSPRTGVCRSQSQQHLSRSGALVTSWGLSGRASLVP